jgi:hypothetical protein
MANQFEIIGVQQSWDGTGKCIFGVLNSTEFTLMV